jgi:hypothetical protein
MARKPTTAVRRFNYIDRVRLPENGVDIRTFPNASGTICAKIDRIEIDRPKQQSRNFARFANGKVILRARDKASDAYFQRVLGTVAEVEALSTGGMPELTMKGFRDISSIKFDLLVVAEDKQVMASLLDFRADNDKPTSKEQLFKIVSKPIGEQVWLIDWEDDRPTIVFDTECAHLVDSELTRVMVFPHVIRAVLPKAIEKTMVDDDCADPYHADVMAWAESFAGPYSPSNPGWIETVVTKFTARHQLKRAYFNSLED